MPLPLGPLITAVQTLSDAAVKTIDILHHLIHRKDRNTPEADEVKRRHVNWEEEYTKLLIAYQIAIDEHHSDNREEILALRERLALLEGQREAIHTSVSQVPTLAVPDVKAIIQAVQTLCSRRHEHYTASAQGLVHQGLVFLSVAHINKRHVFALAVQGNDPTSAQARYCRLPAELPFRYRVDWHAPHWEKAVTEGVRRYQTDPTQFTVLPQPGLGQMLDALDQHILETEGSAA